jgi:osmoprotectant transport system ATP-binding protein
VIAIEDLTRIFGERRAVDHVSFTVPRGSITAVVGASGSGKSTLLRMINRLVEPTSGRVLIAGRDVREVPAYELRRGIGYVIQGYGLFPHRTVAENVATVPKLLGWDPAKTDARVAELLESFGLDPLLFSGKYPGELSGGEQQRVGVARALAARPELMLMDEPFGALDPVIRGKAQEDLLALQRRLGVTVLFVTHDMDEAFRLGDRIAVMDQGRLLQEASPAEILAKPADPLVAALTGSADRALRLLSLTSAGAAAEPGDADGPEVPAAGSLRDALSAMVWAGVREARVVDDRDRPVGRLTLDGVLARGRP